MLRERAILYYPLVILSLFAVFPYAQFAREDVTFGQFIVPFAILMFGTGLLLTLLRLVIKDSARVGVIVSILILALFAYGPVLELMADHNVSIAGVMIGRQRYLLIPTAVIALVGITVALRHPGNLAPLLRAAAVGALILVIFNSGRIVVASAESSDRGFRNVEFVGELIPPPGFEELPDIYYIILDSYGNADALEEVYGFDNSEFIKSLTQKGFYVVPDARSNYPHTFGSLLSSLNMRYHEGDFRQADSREYDLGFQNNAILQFVKSQGYRYVHVESEVYFTKPNAYADIDEFHVDSGLPTLLNKYTTLLLRSTWLRMSVQTLGFDILAPLYDARAERFNSAMQYVKKIPDMPEPTFTFNHNYPPRGPFIFDRDGNRITPWPEESVREEFYRLRYRDQLLYVNRMVGELVDEILERSPAEPVIIIQGDHGPGQKNDDLSGFSKEASDEHVFLRTGILNAFYLPGYCKSRPQPSITPVNTFRFVFDSCLGTNFGLLPDKIYWVAQEPPIDPPRVRK